MLLPAPPIPLLRLPGPPSNLLTLLPLPLTPPPLLLAFSRFTDMAAAALLIDCLLHRRREGNVDVTRSSFFRAGLPITATVLAAGASADELSASGDEFPLLSFEPCTEEPLLLLEMAEVVDKDPSEPVAPC